jgi:hypothetical protein
MQLEFDFFPGGLSSLDRRFAQRCIQPSSDGRNRGRFENRVDGELDPEGFANPSCGPRRRYGMTAQLEKIVVHAYKLNPKK